MLQKYEYTHHHGFFLSFDQDQHGFTDMPIREEDLSVVFRCAPSPNCSISSYNLINHETSRFLLEKNHELDNLG